MLQKIHSFIYLNQITFVAEFDVNFFSNAINSNDLTNGYYC